MKITIRKRVILVFLQQTKLKKWRRSPIIIWIVITLKSNSLALKKRIIHTSQNLLWFSPHLNVRVVYQMIISHSNPIHIQILTIIFSWLMTMATPFLRISFQSHRSLTNKFKWTIRMMICTFYQHLKWWCIKEHHSEFHRMFKHKINWFTNEICNSNNQLVKTT